MIYTVRTWVIAKMWTLTFFLKKVEDNRQKVTFFLNIVYADKYILIYIEFIITNMFWYFQNMTFFILARVMVPSVLLSHLMYRKLIYMLLTVPIYWCKISCEWKGTGVLIAPISSCRSQVRGVLIYLFFEYIFSSCKAIDLDMIMYNVYSQVFFVTFTTLYVHLLRRRRMYFSSLLTPLLISGKMEKKHPADMFFYF